MVDKASPSTSLNKCLERNEFIKTQCKNELQKAEAWEIGQKVDFNMKGILTFIQLIIFRFLFEIDLQMFRV